MSRESFAPEIMRTCRRSSVRSRKRLAQRKISGFRYGKARIPIWLVEVFFALRGLLFMGRKYICPCCGWRLRAFTMGGDSFKTRHLGYCPRCYSKARHRRIWLFLEQKTNIFSDHLRLFHISPWYSLSRQFIKMRNIDYLGIDLSERPNISMLMDLTTTPIRSEEFDAVICVHVLEEIVEDRKAIQELFRVLKPGGWALISVPSRLDQKTYEDSTIVSPKERKRAFGETAHVRVYGYDLIERLEDSGFQVQLDLAKDVSLQDREKFGLRDDENIFFCLKA